MLTERFREVIARVEQLPEQEQDALAETLEAELDEDERWAAAMNAPEDLMLDKLLAEAREQVARGEDRDLDELL